MNTNQKNESDDFKGKVAIVTGAASGISLAITKLLAARGASVVAEDINADVVERFKGDDRILQFVGDVGTEEAAQKVVAIAQVRFGRLDILVNKDYSYGFLL